MIPFLDFSGEASSKTGGTGHALHFAHANGYPTGAYAPLLADLASHSHGGQKASVRAVLQRPLWPGADPAALTSWEPLVADLIRFWEEHAEQPAFGVGHSLGAVLTLAAAVRRPDLLRAVILIDPILFSPALQVAMDTARRLGWARRLHPLVGPALHRRRVFESQQAAFARYREKDIFSGLDDARLRACVEAMTQPRSDGAVGPGVELVYSPEWEAAVYATGPFNVWPLISRLNLPLLVVQGQRSHACSPANMRRLERRHPCAVYKVVPGAGHMLPLEKPDEVADILRKYMERV